MSAAFPEVPRPLADQLASRGRLVQPIGSGGQEEVVLFTKADRGLERTTSVTAAHFVRLYGFHGYGVAEGLLDVSTLRAAGSRNVMELEERTLEEPFERHCEICGAELTGPEIHVAREANGPFLCSVHAAAELPAQDDEAPDSQSSATGAPGPGQPGP